MTKMSTSDSFEFDTAPAADSGHKDWIEIESMSPPIFRSITAGQSDADFRTVDSGVDDGEIASWDFFEAWPS